MRAAAAAAPSRVFALRFEGDPSASQVRELREEVTAVLQGARAGDEVVLSLTTGGGTVTGYGLAAAQLVRLKDAGVRLTICCEQVAASGGYMMACVADRLVASPFAIIGSIGVIGEVPNAYERLNREGIEFLTVTAGKYKRTLTPFKKPTKEDIAKQQGDLEDILKLFKGFVAEHRPSLDIEQVATGEVWFGRDALKQGLVDELVTTDELLLQRHRDGVEVYSVRYQDPDSARCAGCSAPSAPRAAAASARAAAPSRPRPFGRRARRPRGALTRPARLEAAQQERGLRARSGTAANFLVDPKYGISADFSTPPRVLRRALGVSGVALWGSARNQNREASASRELARRSRPCNSWCIRP